MVIFWLGRKFLGADKLKDLFVKREEAEKSLVREQAKDEEKEKLEVIKEEKEEDARTKQIGDDLEKIEIQVN